MFKTLIHKIQQSYKERQKKKIFITDYKKTLKNKGNILLVNHYGGYDRGGLKLTSHDKQQLKDLQLSLKNRGYKSELLEDYEGGVCLYSCYDETRVNLTPELMKNQISLEERFKQYLKFADDYFINGRPIPNYDFFNDDEKKILTKWEYKKKGSN